MDGENDEESSPEVLLKENLVEDQFEEVHVNLLNCTSEIFVDSPTRVIEENAVHLEESEKLDDSKGDEVTNHESVESGIIKVEPNCQSLDSEVLSTNSPGVNSHEVDRGDTPEETETKNCVSLVGDDKTALGFSSEKERSLDVATEECAKIDPSSQLFNSQIHTADASILQSTSSTPEILDEHSKSPTFTRGDLDSLLFQEDLIDLINKVYEDLRLVQSSLSQDYLYMLEIFEEFWKHRNTMLEDAIKKADELVEILRKTEEADNSKRMDLLDHIKACFSGGRWLTKSVNTKAAAHIKELLTMYVQLNLGEVSKVKSLVDNFLLNPGSIMRVRDPTPRPNCDPFLVTVTCIVDPGEFYVVRWCDEGKRDRLQRSFEKEALNYLKPEEIITGQMYAVLSKDTKWYRGICGQQCGIYQVGDSLPEKLYSFSFVDDGRQETIRSALIRCLPDELVVIPAMALQCTLNHNFKRIPFNGEATARFKQATRRSPMSMKIFSQDGGILNVDLSQIPCFGEDNYYVSIRDALFLDHFIRAAPVTTVELPLRKFKAKYGLADINCKRGETLRVKISDALNPANVYVNVLDEDWLLFAEVHRSLQEEFADNQTDIPHEVYKGYICAAKSAGEWHRALIEEPSVSEQIRVFLVDVGRRTTVNRANCRTLPDRFLEFPAQSVRCVLDGLQPKLNQRQRVKPVGKWDHRAYSYLQSRINRKALLNAEYIAGCQVGKIDLSKELTFYCILHIDGQDRSVNLDMCMQGYATTSKKTSIPDIEHIRILIPQEEATESVVIFNSDSNQSPSEEIVQVTSAETSHETGDAQESAETSVPFNSPELSPLGSEDAFQSKTDQDLSQPSTSRPSDMLAEEPQASSQDSIQKEGVGTSIDSSENHSLLSSRTAGEQATETLESQRKESHPAPKAVDGANCFVFPAGMPRSQQESSNLFSIEDSTCSNAPAASIRIREQSLSVRNDVPGSILGFQLIEGEVCVLLKFSWCQSPNAIYFRTREMSEMMHALNTKMREHYKDSKPVASLLNFEIGCMCAVFCEENWQRAQIIDIDESSTFEVNLLDRGLQRTVDASNIRRIEPEFEKYPKLILGVSLYGVYPVSGNWDQKVNHFITEKLMAAKEIKFFRRRPVNSREQFMTGIVFRGFQQKVREQLIDVSAGKCLNEELISEGYAYAQPDEYPLMPAPKPAAWKKPINPNICDRFWAAVTCVSNDCDVFLHRVKDAKKLREISSWLAKAFGNTQPSDADLAARPGDLCIAKYNDGKWYRGVVETVHPDKGTADVVYVDYGNGEEVSLRDIRLNVMLEDIPMQALRCKIQNIKPVGGASSWDDKAISEIGKILVEKELPCRVMAVGPALSVVLGRGNNLIAQELVDKGLAEHVESPSKIKRRNRKLVKKYGPR